MIEKIQVHGVQNTEARMISYLQKLDENRGMGRAPPHHKH
jgi:hypothetical protein